MGLFVGCFWGLTLQTLADVVVVPEEVEIAVDTLEGWGS